MPTTFTKKHAGKHRLVYLAEGDGTVGPATRTNAELLADMEAGPLKDAFNATYANQAAMRAALLEQNVRVNIRKRAVVAGVTAEVSDWAADVDTDAATPTKAELNVTAPDQNGGACYIEIEYIHSLNQ